MKTVKNLYNQISALVWKEDNWFVAKALEVEVASQGKSKSEALESLKEALQLYFEDEVSVTISPIKQASVEKIKFLRA
ncbi:HicB family protein [candidate division WWE3 bacterium CG10_big_fil_rev_8_21_14_0_10_35_32]|nr:MAG: HicB family protein [candidate division WWE3 bacterium CG10_big_fil_rev_8_21_14_0_10_35_32]